MKNKGTWGTVILIVVAIVVLGVIFAWGKTEQKSNTAQDDINTTEPTATTDSSDAGKLGENEVAITAANFDAEVVKGSNGKLVVVDVYAPWCPHCQKMGPIMTALSDEFAGKVKFGKMNADNQDESVKANFDFAVSKGLEGYPTSWFYKDGELVYSFSGEKTQDELKADIQKYQ
jgi:thioredoxin-like negative regulator of GroEL